MSDLQERFHRLSQDVEAEPMIAPAAIRRRGDARTRRQLAAAAVGAAGAVVVGVIAVNVSGGRDDRVGPIVTPTPAPSASESPSPSPSESPSESPTPIPSPSSFANDMPPSHAKQVLVGPVILDVPEGWQADNAFAAAHTINLSGRAEDAASGAPTFNHACIEPSTTRPAMFGCAGLDVWYSWSDSDYLPGNELASFTDAPGWYPGTDVQSCPVKPADGPNGVNGVRMDPGVTHDLRPVGDRTADFYQWRAHCDDGYTFSPRAWYLPVSQVVIFDRVGYPDLNSIVTSARFDTGRWAVGLLKRADTTTDGTTVAFDELRWLGGKKALAYNESQGGHGMPADDFETVNPDTSTVTLSVSSDALVVSEFDLAGTAPGHHVAVSLPRLVDYVNDVKTHGYQTFHLHIRADGIVDQVWQQYTP